MNIPDEAVQAALTKWYEMPSTGDSSSQKRDMRAALTAALPFLQEVKVYTVGDNTMEKVFKPSGLTSVHDLQAVLDAVESALYPSPRALALEEAGFRKEYAALGRTLNSLALNANDEDMKPAVAELSRRIFRTLLGVNPSPLGSVEDITSSVDNRYGLEVAAKWHETEAEYYEARHGDKDGVTFPIVAGWHRLHAERIRSLSSQPVADGWLPIETAPKDGTEFIGWDGKRPFRCSNTKHYVKYPHEEGGPTYRNVWSGHYYDSIMPENPTHWRPLPASPGASE